MFLSTLFGFCSRKDIYKLNIQSCFDEYKSYHYNVKRKVSDYHPYMGISKINSMDKETKDFIRDNANKQNETVKEMVSLVNIYCKKFSLD